MIVAGFRVSGHMKVSVHYKAHPGEFCHIGSFISRYCAKYYDSLVFGLGGMLIPTEAVREFAIFFYKFCAGPIQEDITHRCVFLDWTSTELIE